MAQINIRMDDSLKENMEVLCDELGMSMTTAFTVFARKMVRERRIPFDVSVDAFYSEANMLALSESLRQLDSGKTIEKTMAELEAMADE